MRKIGKFSNIHQIIDVLLSLHLKENSICIDATLGNGYDTLKLSQLLNGSGKIYSFDIQKIAIEKSKELFKKKNIDTSNIKLINDNHCNVESYVDESIDFFIMNLGYLPSGDKSITTNYSDVISFLDKVLLKMNSNSYGLVVFYPGHIIGMEEYINVTKYLEKLEQLKFNIIKIEHINQINFPPKLVIIERI